MTVQWYFRRIRHTISLMYECREGILLANRQLVANFVSSRQVSWVEDFLSGLRSVSDFDSTDWESDVMFAKFKDYVIENEQRIERKLRDFSYYIDEANTLSLVAGDGRPEKVSLFICAHISGRYSQSILSVHHDRHLPPFPEVTKYHSASAGRHSIGE